MSKYIERLREKYTSKHYRRDAQGKWGWVNIPGENDILSKDSPDGFKDVSSLPAIKKSVVYVEPLPKLKSGDRKKTTSTQRGPSTRHRGESSIPAWEQGAINELESLMASKNAGIISQAEYNEELDEIREMYDI